MLITPADQLVVAQACHCCSGPRVSVPPDCGSWLCLFWRTPWSGTVCCAPQPLAPSLSLCPTRWTSPASLRWVSGCTSSSMMPPQVGGGWGGLPLAGDRILVECIVLCSTLLCCPPAQPGSLLLLLLLQQTRLDRMRRAGRAAASPPSPRAAAGSAQQQMAPSLPGSMVRLWAVPVVPVAEILSAWRSGLHCTFFFVLFRPVHAVCSCGAWLCAVEGQRCARVWFNLASACGATPLPATGDNLADSGTGTALNKDEVHFTAK